MKPQLKTSTHTRQRQTNLTPRHDRPENEDGPELPIPIISFAFESAPDFAVSVAEGDDTVPSFRDLRAQRVEMLDGAAAAGADVREDAVGGALFVRGGWG